MNLEKSETPLREGYFEIFGRRNMNLLWQLKEILSCLPARHVLDMGGGTCVSKNICLPEQIERASVIEPNRRMNKSFTKEFQDDRIVFLEGDIETAVTENTSFDLVFFILSLLWMEDPRAALQKAVSTSPAYLVISTPEFSLQQREGIDSCFPDKAREFIDRLEAYDAQDLDIDVIMEDCGYYPLSIYNSAAWRPTPDHRVRTVLYTKEVPDRTPYEKVKFIVQVNSVCNCNCPICYVEKTGEHMDANVFKDLLEKVHDNETICLRGGEPTLTENLIGDFIQPALSKGIHVILESNGAFINSNQYQAYLDMLTHDNIEIRLSLDRQHIDSFPKPVRPLKIKWLSRFIEDAIRLDISFGLFSLGMCRAQIKQFLDEYSIVSWLPFIKPLTKYSDITELPIRGQFVDVNGKIHDHITGVGWIGSPDIGNFEKLLSSAI